MSFETETACEKDFWYLVHCQSRKETYAANSLKHILKLLVFVPEIQVRSHGTIKCSPFFPGYIFVNANLQNIPKSLINTCPGVLRIVEFGDSPQAVPQYVIDTIVQQLNRFNGVHSQPYPSFRPGELVQMKYGPLQDLEMVFVGTTPGGRIRVLLELLGRIKEVQLDMSILEKALPKATAMRIGD